MFHQSYLFLLIVAPILAHARFSMSNTNNHLLLSSTIAADACDCHDIIEINENINLISSSLTDIHQSTGDVLEENCTEKDNIHSINTAETIASSIDEVGNANLDWPSMGFEYRGTNGFAQIDYKDGKWGPIEWKTEPFIKMHIGATALHYGQSCFEGLKAFHSKDGKVRLFRPMENALRLQQTCTRTYMPPVPTDLFIDACRLTVRNNLAFVPPYGSGGAFYLRPLLFGTSPRIGVQPASEYTMVIVSVPTSTYYNGAVPAMIIEGYDRAAPDGVGNVKVAGNYAADLLPNMSAKKQGFPMALYLDPLTKSYIEEFSAANFLAVDQNGAYITPDSRSILASITNKSLMEIAKDEGIDVQRRPIHVDELSTFREVAACGTGVIVTPINKIVYGEKVFLISDGIPEIGPVINKLYLRLKGIQHGELPDTFGWMVTV